MRKLSKYECEMILDKIYEKVESGELSPKNQNKVVSLFENQNPEFTESIIDDQLERLERMYKDGKLSKEDYIKQKASWIQRRGRYDENSKRAKKKEEEERLKEERRPINRIRSAIRKRDEERKYAVESSDDFWTCTY